MKTWLTAHCRLSGAEATALVRAARRLPALPELQAAYASGAVSAAHVQVVTAAVTPARIAAAADAGIDLATTDQLLTEAARVLGPEDTEKAARRWVAGVDPDGLLDDSAGLPRMLRMAPSSGGRVYLSGHLDPVGGETVHAALEAVMNGHRPADDRRSHAERQGDALVELCRQALNGGALPDGAGRTTPRAREHRPAGAVRRAGVRRAALRRADHRRDRPAASPATPESRGSSPARTDCRWMSGREQRSSVGRYPAGHRDPRRALRLRGLHGPGRLVRRPPRRPLGLRRADLVRERGPALRTAPHRRSRRPLQPSPATRAPPCGTPTAPTAARS